MAKPAEIRKIFEAVIELSTGDELEQYLDAACGDDVELRAEVESLIRSHDSSGRFLGGNVASAKDEEQRAIPQKVGRYRIREQIGEGGMGVVYVAEQTEPVQRKVALKIIKPGMDTKEVIARFEAERQALAFMEHPNIARVLDAGATQSGRSYFVMELVGGIPITEYCDQVKATPRERLELFKTVCDAVQHAHQKGIIHRDIKPSNVLVTQVSAKPVVKVIDFGLAKAVSGQRLTEKTLYTGFMKLMGTPAYMSPEQAGLSGLDVDTRSDIYSLGILLYELLTGTTPLDNTEIQRQTYDEICRQVRETDAPKPSTRFSTLQDAQRSTIAKQRQIEPRELRHLLNGDLDLVVLKAIDKDRDRRYGSPQDLAADIERFLQDQPVLAVPPSQWYLARKYMRRHRAAILMATTIFILLVVATALSSWQAFEARKANRLAEARTESALAARAEADAAKKDAIRLRDQQAQTAAIRRRLLYASNMQLADQIWNRPSGTFAEIQELLVSWIPVGAGPDLRDFSWRFQWTRLHNTAQHTLQRTRDIAFSPDGNFVISDQSGIRKWDGENNILVQQWTDEQASSGTSLSPCGRWAAAHGDGTIRFIDTEHGEVVCETTGHEATFGVGGDFVLVRDSRDGANRFFKLPSGDREMLPNEVTRRLEAIRDADKGQEKLSSIGPNGKSFLFFDRGNLTAFFDGHDQRSWQSRSYISTTAMSEDGRLFGIGLHFGPVHIRKSRVPSWGVELDVPSLKRTALSFSLDSQRVAVGGSNGNVHVWDISQLDNGLAQGGRPLLLHSLKAHLKSISRITFSPDGNQLATRADDGEAKVWRLDPTTDLNRMTTRAPDLYGAMTGVGFETADDGVRVSSVNPESHEVLAGDVAVGDRIVDVVNQDGHHEINEELDAFDVRNMTYGPKESVVTLHVEKAGQAPSRVVKLRRTLAREPAPSELTFIQNGSAIAVCDWGLGAVTVTKGGRVTRRFPYRGCSSVLSPDGKLLALDDFRHIVLWDLENDKLHARWESRVPTSEYAAYRSTICFSPDGRYLAAGTGFRFNSDPKTSHLKVWEIAAKQEIKDAPLLTSKRVISGVAFSPDGRRLLAATQDGTLRLFDTFDWSLERTLFVDFPTASLAISPNGDTIALGGSRGIVLLDFASGSRQRVLRGHAAYDLIFSADGKTLVLTGEKVVMIDVATGIHLATMTGNSALVTGGAFSPDGSTLATIDLNGDLRLSNSLPLEQIDRDPLTIVALHRRGKQLLGDGKFSQAEQTLQRVVELHGTSPASDIVDMHETYELLEQSQIGQGKSLLRANPRDKPPPL